MESFIVFPNIAEDFQATVKPLDIIEAGLLKKDANTNFMILFEFKVIYTNVKKQVGRPIKYSPGIINNEGSNSIPDEIIFGGNRKTENHPLEGFNLGDAGNIVAYKIESDDESEAVDHFTEINNLSHYDRSFKIRGRVIKLSPMRTFKKKDGTDGYVFNAVIQD